MPISPSAFDDNGAPEKVINNKKFNLQLAKQQSTRSDVLVGSFVLMLDNTERMNSLLNDAETSANFQENVLSLGRLELEAHIDDLTARQQSADIKISRLQSKTKPRIL